MKTIIMAASAASLALLSTAASAQVTGNLATADPVIAIARAKAFAAANQQIQTTYKSYLDQVDAKIQQRQALLAKLDKNNDKQVDQSELDAAKKAKSPELTQVDKIEKDMNQLQLPVRRAQVFALESIARHYTEALNKVVTDRKIVMVVKPDSLMYAPPTADVTASITAELDQAVPSVSVTPPENWQPSQSVVELYQQIQELAAESRAQSQAQPQAAAPAQQPATNQPQGR